MCISAMGRMGLARRLEEGGSLVAVFRGDPPLPLWRRILEPTLEFVAGLIIGVVVTSILFLLGVLP